MFSQLPLIPVAMMNHGADENVKEPLLPEVTIKTEVEEAAHSFTCVDIEIDPDYLKQEPGLVQSAKSEPALLVKEEVLEDSSQASPKCSGQNMAEDDHDEAHVKTCLHKPHSLNAQNNVNQRDIRMDFMMTSSVVASNQNTDETTQTKQKPNVCDKGYSSNAAQFAQKCYVPNQRRVCTGQKRYNCNMCNATFARKSGLTDHMRVHTGEKPCLCKICDARFSRKTNLDRHMRVHTGVKPYRCELCDTRFKQRGALTVHMRAHTGEKPYRCDMCDTRFKQRGALIVHMKVHMGEKPHWCDTCDARFARKSNLITHMRIHTSEKPYQCDICDTRFKQRGALTVHKRIHTGEKPYRCGTCDTTFARNYNLSRHMSVHISKKLN